MLNFCIVVSDGKESLECEYIWIISGAEYFPVMKRLQSLREVWAQYYTYRLQYQVLPG